MAQLALLCARNSCRRPKSSFSKCAGLKEGCSDIHRLISPHASCRWVIEHFGLTHLFGVMTLIPAFSGISRWLRQSLHVETHLPLVISPICLTSLVLATGSSQNDPFEVQSSSSGDSISHISTNWHDVQSRASRHTFCQAYQKHLTKCNFSIASCILVSPAYRYVQGKARTLKPV